MQKPCANSTNGEIFQVVFGLLHVRAVVYMAGGWHGRGSAPAVELAQGFCPCVYQKHERRSAPPGGLPDLGNRSELTQLAPLREDGLPG